MARILIIEDEERILMGLEDDLGLEGHEVVGATDGAEGLRMARQGGFDLVVLDLMLPSLDGLEICRSLRQDGDPTPILILSAKSQEVDRVVGLELGADDYVTKPFSPRELVARVKALLRRTGRPTPDLEGFRFDEVEVDFRRRVVRRDGEPVEVTATELELLRCLIEHRDEALDRGEILAEVWGDDWDVFPRTVDSHIAHLRQKLERDPANPRHIRNVRGVGYRFDP